MPNPFSLRDQSSIARLGLATTADLRPDVAAAARFTDQLAEFTTSDWLSASVEAKTDAAARSAARAAVDAIVREKSFGVQAWNALDDVQTVSQCTYPESSNVAMSKHIATKLRSARELAANAALALLVRKWLNADQFDTLYRPFALRIKR